MKREDRWIPRRERRWHVPTRRQRRKRTPTFRSSSSSIDSFSHPDPRPRTIATMARTNKCLAQGNKSDTRAQATKQQSNPSRRNPRRVCAGWRTSHDAGRSQINRAPSRAHSAQSTLWRLLREVSRWKRATPYYTVDLEDAVNAAVRMARTASMMSAMTATQATPFSGCHQQTFSAQERIPGHGQSD